MSPNPKHQSRILPMPLGHSGVQFSNPALQFSRQFPHNSLYPVSNSQWCFRPSRSPQPFGFGSVFGRPCPRIRNTEAVVLCLLVTPTVVTCSWLYSLHTVLYSRLALSPF